MNDWMLHDLALQPNELARNRALFAYLKDDDARESLYRELGAQGFPALRFKSVLRRNGSTRGWPSEDVYLLTARKDIERALRGGSVQPYAGLDSGGKFMLGVDDPGRHAAQRGHAFGALNKLTPAEIDRCVAEALRRTLVLPRKSQEFDLVEDVASQAALRLIALVFGLPAKAHVLLERAMQATYTRLTFQIIGRHFVPDDGLPPPDSDDARKAREELEQHVERAAAGRDWPEWWDEGLLSRSVSSMLARTYGADSEMTRIVVLGLMAGTVGNVTSAVANTIDHFFRTEDGRGGRLIDEAADAARYGDVQRLQQLVREAMGRRPPAPFLARTARGGMVVSGGRRGSDHAVPEGSHLLLAMGADQPVDPDLLFGGPLSDGSFVHSCIGRHLAWPLIHETVRQVLRLPGLARVIDATTGQPKPLEKQWGAICQAFPLQFQRDRLRNQQPLFLVLPIKEPVGVNAGHLQLLTRAGAPVIERALADAKNVHFAWFGIVEGGTHLAMYTVYDGDFDAYVEHFALKVPLFDEQFKYLEGAPPTPVRLYPKDFVAFIKKHNRAPLANYFYSGYPRTGVAEIDNAGLGGP